jgi:maltose alpha-D-glucosyltransferase/alpha-amylase
MLCPVVICDQGPDGSQAEEQYRHAARTFREFLQWRARATASCSAEANVLPETDMEYFGDDGDRMHMMFNFQSTALVLRPAAADAAAIDQAMRAPSRGPPRHNGGQFFRETMTS